MYLTRTVIFQLVQALKFKSCLPDENFLLLVQVSFNFLEKKLDNTTMLHNKVLNTRTKKTKQKKQEDQSSYVTVFWVFLAFSKFLVSDSMDTQAD